MAEVGSIVVNARMYTDQFTKGSKRLQQDLQEINQKVESGQRSMKAYYQTLERSANFGPIEQRVRDRLAERIKEARGAELAKDIEAQVNGRMRAMGLNSGNGFAQAFAAAAGGSGDLKNIMETLRGGALVAGVALAGRTMREMAETSARIATDLRTGAISVKEAAEELVGSAPIIGDFWRAGRAIREVITGEGAEAQTLLNAANSEMQRVIARGEAVNELIRAKAEFERDQLERQRAAQIAAGGAFWGEWLKKSFEAQDRIEKINQRFDGIIQANPGLAGKANEERGRELSAAWDDLRGAKINLVRNALRGAFDDVSSSAVKAFNLYVNGIRSAVEQRLKASRDIVQDIRERVATLGMDEKALKIRELEKNGATADQIKEATDGLDRIAAYNKVAAAIEEQKRILEAPAREIRMPEGRERRFTFASPGLAPNVRDPQRVEAQQTISLLRQILDAIKNNKGTVIPTLSID
jgi:hypothetical protein